MSKSIKKRILQEKKQLLEYLEKVPIVQVACEKAGVGRSTYYRWRKDDERFTEEADMAIYKGKSFVNDMAESQLMTLIKEQNLTAIIFWLKHNHPSYATRVELTAKLKKNDETLTPEQEALVMRALSLASLLPTEKKSEDVTSSKNHDNDVSPVT
jgi:ACT domain-containing protein